MKEKIMTEKETRKRLMRFAKLLGAQEDLEQVFIKWDAIMAMAPVNERSSMAHMAILEVEKLLDIYSAQRDGLTINGKVIIPAGRKEPETLIPEIGKKS